MANDLTKISTYTRPSTGVVTPVNTARPAPSSLSGPAQVDAEIQRLSGSDYNTHAANRMAMGNTSFNNLMASNSRPISGTVVSNGMYRGQPVNQGAYDQLLADAGLDNMGNPVDLQPVNIPDAPTYTSPEVDEAGVDKYSRSNLAPMLSRLRSALNKNVLAAKNEDNPNVRKMYTGAAMSGYGEGLSSATASARNTGRRDYMSMEYQPKLYESQMNYQTDVNKWKAGVTDMISKRDAALRTLNYRR